MSYWPIHNYRQRDKLPPNDPNKIIYGSHLSDDFEAIAKSMGVIESHVDNIIELPAVNDSLEKRVAALEKEIDGGTYNGS